MHTETLYHGTSSVNIPSILAKGLVPRGAKGGDTWASQRCLNFGQDREAPHVFVTSDKTIASTFAAIACKINGGDPVVLKLHVPPAVGASLEPDPAFDPPWVPAKAFRTTEAIPASAVIGQLDARRIAHDAQMRAV